MVSSSLLMILSPPHLYAIAIAIPNVIHPMSHATKNTLSPSPNDNIAPTIAVPNPKHMMEKQNIPNALKSTLLMILPPTVRKLHRASGL